jgi:putative ABC transport system substrate-binding protein
MRRRIFLAGLICSCVVRSASAQHSGKIWRVAYLNPGVATAEGSSIYRDWLRRMGELGYVEGENLVVDLRYAEGDYSRLPQLVHELIELKPDALLAIATPAIAAAQRATTTIPIIMGPATDPVGSVRQDRLPARQVADTCLLGPGDNQANPWAAPPRSKPAGARAADQHRK